jgi:cysteine desulfurase/selenocysteine lyase
VIKVIGVDENGVLDLEHYQQLISEKTKIVSLVHASNVLGTINPVKAIIDIAHQKDIPVLLDGAQSAPHMPIDVQALDCDFFVFSAHKLYGPTGTGILYGKEKHLAALPPYQGGGDMIRSVSFEKTDYNVLPYKFEAGTPNIAGAVGLAAAIDYVNKIGMQAIAQHEADLLHYAMEQLTTIPGLKIIGTAPQKVGVISFVMETAHPHDIGTILDHEGIAIRAGHHCAMPLMTHYGLPATARASFGIYNNKRDVSRLVSALHKVRAVFNV